MLSNEIFALFNRVRAKKGANAKKAMLEPYINDPEIIEVLRFAMSPYITFGVGKKMLEGVMASLEALEANGEQGQYGFSEETWELLEKLANRELTGIKASDAIYEEMTQLDPDSVDLLHQILVKDLKLGMKASSINSIRAKTIPQYKVNLAKKYDDEKDKITFPMSLEIKLDGMRLLSHINFDENGIPSDVTHFSREGIEQPNAASVNRSLMLMAEHIAEAEPAFIRTGLFVDGEICCNDSYKITMQQMRKKDHLAEQPVFTVFWFQSLEAFLTQEKTGMTYGQFRKWVSKNLSVKSFEHQEPVHAATVQDDDNDYKVVSKTEIAKSYFVNSHYEIQRYYGNARAADKEGVMVKFPDAGYSYTRSNNWLKMKDKHTLDLAITDFVEGEGKYEDALGAFVVDYNGVSVEVGSGLSDAVREQVWEDPEDYLDTIIEVSYQEITEKGSLRHPVFEGFRDDKSESDSKAEEDEKEEA